MNISIIISTYNPNIQRLRQTIKGLKEQTFPLSNWELIIVDNNSSVKFANQIDLSWHNNSKIIVEDIQGLTYARVRGFQEAKGALIIMVDDDNILENTYLQEVSNVFDRNPALGAFGGKAIPIFEIEPPKWIEYFYGNLALRDLGDNRIIDQWQNCLPSSAPLGAGMAIRKKALNSYIQKINTNNHIISDRKGNSLSSGGDNDIVLEILKSGWQTAYIPTLLLYHLIPKERISWKYLSRLSNDSSKSWIQLLDSHNINPWEKIDSWTVPLRKIKAWFVYKAWLNKVNHIRWRGACGLYEGLAMNKISVESKY